MPSVSGNERTDPLIRRRYFRAGQQPYIQSAEVARWTAILSVAERFIFEKLRKHAIEELERNWDCMTTVSRLCLAHQFDISQWLHRTYADLVIRDHPLSVDEAEQIGYPTAILVAQAREQVLRSFHDQFDDMFKKEFASNAVKNIFGYFVCHRDVFLRKTASEN